MRFMTSSLVRTHISGHSPEAQPLGAGSEGAAGAAAKNAYIVPVHAIRPCTWAFCLFMGVFVSQSWGPGVGSE